MSTSNPKVSICSSVLNQTTWAREMIASVVAQTFTDWEMIVVDDGSTEDLKSVVDSFDDKRIKYHLFVENKGIPHGINYAFQMARGEYVNALAADEMITPDKLEKQVAYLERHREVDCVWGLPQFCDGQESVLLGERPMWEQCAMKAHNRSRESWIRTLLNLESVPLGSCSATWRRSVFESIGYFDPSLTAFCDHEWYVRFFEKHTGHVMNHRVALCRPNPDQVSGPKNAERNLAELKQVRAMHPPKLPSITGKVTVGIPVYNMAEYIGDAIRSVLAQTHQDFMLLVLDDGSTDNIADEMKTFTDPRIKFMRQENQGAHAATNELAAKAVGRFFVPLSADDTLEPDFLEKCLAEFKVNPYLEFVASQTDFIGIDGKEYPDKSHPFYTIEKATNKTQADWKTRLWHGNVYFGVGMYRLSAWHQCGGRKSELKVISDYELYLNLLQRENIRIIEKNLTHTRIQGKNMSLMNPKEAAELPQLYHDAKKPYYRQLMKVIIATPFYELKGFSPYIASLTATIRQLMASGIDWRFLELSGDSYVHRARNTICDLFLQDPDATDLFFIDSDMSWNAESFVKMCLLPDGIVGGSYPVKNNWAGWTSIPKTHEEEGKQHFRGRDLGDGTALIEAQVLAGGFLRIKRSVLEQFREHYKDKWYKEPTTDKENPERKYTEFFEAGKIDGMFHGEDHAFSRRLRDMGIPMFIYPNVDLNHFGVKGWNGNLDKYLKSQATPAQTA